MTAFCSRNDQLKNRNHFIISWIVWKPDLKFTIEVGGNSVSLIDLKISIINGNLEIHVYSKPTDSHLYLNNKPSLHLWRLCSADNEYLSKSMQYQDYINRRGRDTKTVHETFEKISKITRHDARKRAVNNDSNNNKVIFSTKFNSRRLYVK